jgi:hypothetical protein
VRSTDLLLLLSTLCECAHSNLVALVCCVRQLMKSSRATPFIVLSLPRMQLLLLATTFGYYLASFSCQ